VTVHVRPAADEGRIQLTFFEKSVHFGVALPVHHLDGPTNLVPEILQELPVVLKAFPGNQHRPDSET
jgi:hypothetical protein